MFLRRTSRQVPHGNRADPVPCLAHRDDLLERRQELARQLLVRPLCDLVSPSEKRGRDRAGREQAWGSGEVLGQRGEQVHRRHERRVQAHQTGLPPPGRHPHRPVLKPADYKNSGTGCSGWLPLIRLTAQSSTVRWTRCLRLTELRGQSRGEIVHSRQISPGWSERMGTVGGDPDGPVAVKHAYLARRPPGAGPRRGQGPRWSTRHVKRSPRPRSKRWCTHHSTPRERGIYSVTPK